jgi:carboxymethylenebutenolidase
MGRAIQNVTYGGGELSGYLVQLDRAAAQAPLPAVVVLQEAWGLTPHIEDVAGRYADAGYAALAPDLYARRGVRPAPLARDRMAELLDFVNASGSAVIMDEKARAEALAKLPPASGARVKESLEAVFGGPRNLAAHVPALLAATKFLREENPSTRGAPVGSVGYCMGGGLSALLACHDPELACACIYYGNAPPLERVPAITAPVYGFYGRKDKRLVDGIAPFAEAMKKAGKTFESHVYDGADHAFFNDERPTYDARASRDAFARTLDAFRRHLGT